MSEIQKPAIILDAEDEKGITVQNNLPQSSIGGIDVNSLLAKAIDKETPVETMEKLLAMARQLKADYAMEQFNISLSEFQAACPEIKKEKIVRDKGGGIRYKYAPLEMIVSQVKELIKDYGFSYTIKTEQTETHFTAICDVRHICGHSEKTSFVIPIDVKAYMGAAQKVGAASTYAKRYAFCNAFGIMTGDEDTDANDINDNPPENKSNSKAYYANQKKPPQMTDEEARQNVQTLIEDDRQNEKILTDDEYEKTINALRKTSWEKGYWIRYHEKLINHIESMRVAF